MDDDAEPTPVTETDGDSLPDYLDIDSDNDGIHTGNDIGVSMDIGHGAERLA